MLGLTQDQFRLVFSLVFMIPLSYPLKYMKSQIIKTFYSLIFASAIQLYVYQREMIVIYIEHIIVFLLICFCPRRKVGAIVTAQSLIYLSGYQIYEMIVNYGGWTLDASALLMIYICKYSLLAFAYQDGEIIGTKKLTSQSEYCAIKQRPSFWLYINYLNFLPTSVIGPAFEYNDFIRFIKQQQHFADIPSPLMPIVKSFLYAVSCLAIFKLGDTYFPTSYLKTAQVLENQNLNLLFLFGYCWVALTVIRFKYYFGWKLSMCAVHASGISYSGFGKWLRINSCNPWQVETDLHIKNKIGHWNMSVQQWLRKSIYQRSPFKDKSLSQLYVFMVSAFWHGFYAGYFMSFFLWFLQVHCQTQIFRATKQENSKIRKLYKMTGKVGNIILRMAVGAMFSINASFFILLQPSAGAALIKKMYFIPQLILVVLTIIFSMPWTNQKKVKHQKQQKKQA